VEGKQGGGVKEGGEKEREGAPDAPAMTGGCGWLCGWLLTCVFRVCVVWAWVQVQVWVWAWVCVWVCVGVSVCVRGVMANPMACNV
jgi:hypothetical protein